MPVDRTLYYYETDTPGHFLKLTKHEAARRGLSGGRAHANSDAPVVDGPPPVESKKVEEPSGEPSDTATKKTPAPKKASSRRKKTDDS